MINNSEELLEYLKENKVIIYGTGYIGKLFFRLLDAYCGVENVYCFVVSEHPQNEKLFDKNIFKVSDFCFKENLPLVCIATHEVLVSEIEEKLIENGIKNYIWIFPFIKQMMYQSEISVKYVNINKIVQSNMRDYRLAVRYITIDNYLASKQNDIYIKMMMTFSSKDTAEKRLKLFEKMIDSWKSSGYKEESRITVDADLNVVDGAHRFALAVYYGMDEILCDYCNKVINISKYNDEEVFMNEYSLEKANLTQEEKNRVYSVYNQLKKQYTQT